MKSSLIKVNKKRKYNFMGKILIKNNLGLGLSTTKTINYHSILINLYGIANIINQYIYIYTINYRKKYLPGDLIFIRNKEINLIKEIEFFKKDYIGYRKKEWIFNLFYKYKKGSH